MDQWNNLCVYRAPSSGGTEMNTKFIGWAVALVLSAALMMGAVYQAGQITYQSDLSIANTFGLIVGHTSQLTIGEVSEVQVLGTGGPDSQIAIARFSNDAVGPRIRFLKSLNTTIGSNTIVTDNDVIGQFTFQPDDGVDFDTAAALFRAEVDDPSPAAGDVGIAFVWQQMAGGGGSLAETMRLNSHGVLERNSYRQEFDGPCIRREAADFTAELVVEAGVNLALCEGDIMMFVYRLDGDQTSPFVVQGGALDIDGSGIDDEGVEIILAEAAAPVGGWVEVGTSPAMFMRVSVTMTSVSGTDNFYVGWRKSEAFVDNLVIATYDTYAVHLINSNAGNLVIQTGDDTSDGTDENANNATFADAETIVFEVRIATDGGVTFFTDGVLDVESSATGGFDAGDIAFPVIGLLNASDADTETLINWIEVGEVT